MTQRKRSPAQEKPRLSLREPADELRPRLHARIQKGDQILAAAIRSPEELRAARDLYSKWSAFNAELLKQIATSDELSEEYSFWGVAGPSYPDGDGRAIGQLQEEVREKIHRLESISERLELIPVTGQTHSPVGPLTTGRAIARNRVFIVHGHDSEARESVARFIEQLQLEAIILHEQPNEGMTIIEKLEKNASVGFAVVLLTPDDEGRPAHTDEALRPRARQNVVLELGYFVGSLGRNHVCALHRGPVEIPSDYLNVLYIPLDDGGAWRLRLAKELRAAGLNVDMNRAV